MSSDLDSVLGSDIGEERLSLDIVRHTYITPTTVCAIKKSLSHSVGHGNGGVIEERSIPLSLTRYSLSLYLPITAASATLEWATRALSIS